MVTDLILPQFSAGGGNFDKNIYYASMLPRLYPSKNNVREMGENEGMSCSVWSGLSWVTDNSSTDYDYFPEITEMTLSL